MPVFTSGLIRAVLAIILLQSVLVTAGPVYAGKKKSETRELAGKGITELQSGDFIKANEYFNRALKLDPTSSQLNFLNALTYHARTGSEGVQNYDLADEGYQIAIRHDDTNWLYYYTYGLSRLDRKQYSSATQLLADAVLLNDREPDLLYALVYAAYYASDLSSANAAMYRLSALEPESRRVKAAKILLAAASGDNISASKELSSYERLFPDDDSLRNLKIRAGEWNHMIEYIRSNPDSMSEGQNPGAASMEENLPMPDMVIIDAVILRNEDEITHSKGVNLLNGLSLQFGNSSNPAISFNRAYSSSWTHNPDGTDDTIAKSITNTITGIISVPALTYSMNIFNMGSSKIDVIARPTLTGMLNIDSEFFSGNQIDAAVAGSADSSPISINKEIGVTMHVRPNEITRNKVKLHVEVSRSFLDTTDKDKITYQYMVTTSNTKVTTDVDIAFGETMILSGLYEREAVDTRDGVPILQDIPLLQYLFSKKTERLFQRSVIILLTPYINPKSYNFNTRATVVQDLKKNKSLIKLRKKHPDWYVDVDMTSDRILEHLQHNHFVKEFRSGDLIRYKMVNPANLDYRVGRGFGFLYY
ncbi:type II secretion pathway component PulD-like protein [Pelodictyon luteolum]|uniref:Type II secretory pathway component PulD-like protein n=1 Tax=Chlorobium luteolum (strain DSM 273 / BCRC 81028 / 2530) TaxID=319225 RepID=Q3B440_CHLL3|nr:type II secretion pathway component PulD-like protein [Pelodictyon luteolum]ABB23891.1 Type II secretory pathway component PulD-like protein [Pelodictyon luteolum DSM 273]